LKPKEAPPAEEMPATPRVNPDDKIRREPEAPGALLQDPNETDLPWPAEE
jgi:hypothetical protein